MANMYKQQSHYYVLKRGDVYFEDVWEYIEEDDLLDGYNHSFTDSIQLAYPFYGTLDAGSIPKYMGNSHNQFFETFEDMCAYLQATPVKVTRTVTLEEV